MTVAPRACVGYLLQRDQMIKQGLLRDALQEPSHCVVDPRLALGAGRPGGGMTGEHGERNGPGKQSPDRRCRERTFRPGFPT